MVCVIVPKPTFGFGTHVIIPAFYCTVFTLQVLDKVVVHHTYVSFVKPLMCSTADIWWSDGDLRINKSHILQWLHVWF